VRVRIGGERQREKQTPLSREPKQGSIPGPRDPELRAGA